MKKTLLFVFFLLMVYLATLQFLAFAEDTGTLDSDRFNPKPASASVYNLGLKSYEQSDLDSAITFFKRAIDLDPEFVDAYYNLGAIYKRQKNLPLAISAFQKAVSINPSDAEATFELALCYLEEKDYASAKKFFSVIPNDFPRYGEVRKNLEMIAPHLASESQVKPQNLQAQLLVDTLANTLTQPSKEAFLDKFKIVSGNFSGPTGIAKDSKNNIYIANFVKDSIERVTASGVREIFVEKIGIHGPVGLAIDENDNLYVANYNGNSIVKITQAKEVSVLVSNVVRPYYLFYDTSSKKLFATVQGNDSLVEVDTINTSKQPITSK